MSHGPLSEDEIEWIDEILAKYGSEDAVIDAAELDGLLTALLSMGTKIEPAAEWLMIWGSSGAPQWESEAERQRFEDLVTQHQQDIAERLEHYPEQFEPLFGSDEADNREIVLVEEWCYGYMRGVMSAELSELPPSVRSAFAAIALHGTEEHVATLNQMSPEAFIDSIDQIKPAALALYHHWHRHNSSHVLH